MSERLTAKSAKKVLEITELKKSADIAEKRSADKKLLKFNSKLTDQILSLATSGEIYFEMTINNQETLDFYFSYAKENGYDFYGYKVNSKKIYSELKMCQTQLEEIENTDKKNTLNLKKKFIRFVYNNFKNLVEEYSWVEDLKESTLDFELSLDSIDDCIDWQSIFGDIKNSGFLENSYHIKSNKDLYEVIENLIYFCDDEYRNELLDECESLKESLKSIGKNLNNVYPIEVEKFEYYELSWDRNLNKKNLLEIDRIVASKTFSSFMKICPAILVHEISSQKMQKVLSFIESEIKKQSSNGRNNISIYFNFNDFSLKSYQLAFDENKNECFGVIDSIAALKLAMIYLGYVVEFSEKLDDEEDKICRKILIKW
ncbi:MAG: hypothetical protein K9J78_13110 [Polynucleobacter sp.]|nr:hypothetical protein [Polynucleobacter sp.]